MTAQIIVGGAFGDEAKGKLVDYLSQDAEMVVRYSGGPNAGHTIYHNDTKIVLRLIPSGIFNESVICVIAQGTVIDPLVLSKEIINLKNKKVNLKDRLFVSNRAHVILPKHISAEKSSSLSEKIGTTKKGIGPAYKDKISRTGHRLHEFLDLENENINWINSCFAEQENEYLEAFNIIKPYVTDTSYLVNTYLNCGSDILFEGAQGSLLDIDHGTWPYVTSSNSIAGGACTGAGVGPTMINDVLCVVKAYTTRVGNGPFPTELHGNIAEKLRIAGNEFGSVTKRPRRVGWFDKPLTRYSCMINGATDLIITKLDVLTGFEKIKICESYGDLSVVPYDLSKINAPKYIELDGWEDDISNIKAYGSLPKQVKTYIEFIEDSVEVNVWLLSVGPNRGQIIEIK